MNPPSNGPTELIVENIGQLCTLTDHGSRNAPRRGPALADLGIIVDGVIGIREGRIQAVGGRDQVLQNLSITDKTERIDAGGACVVPGFVDPHTHAVYGRTRQDEYERRLRGETYLEIAAAGGGIQASVQDLRARSEDELQRLTIARLQELAATGTTTIEIKSGYGLTLTDELKMLRVAGAAAAAVGLRLVRTCLAAHEIPWEYRENRRDYMRLVVEEILPAVATARLAERLDVFCEPTVFDLAETTAILRRGRELGLRACLHADELEAFGGAVLAARLGADSADHLIKIDQRGIAALAASDTVAVLLPGTVFTLGLHDYAPARAMIAAGCAVALASDYNPGSSPISSLPLIMAIACTQMKMSPAEALVATTLNAAWALGVADRVGSLTPGKAADFLILDADDYRLVPYHAGRNPVASVYRAGRCTSS